MVTPPSPNNQITGGVADAHCRPVGPLLLQQAVGEDDLDDTRRSGGQPISWVSLACELQRDWGRLETVPQIVGIVLTDRLLKE